MPSFKIGQAVSGYDQCSDFSNVVAAGRFGTCYRGQGKAVGGIVAHVSGLPLALPAAEVALLKKLRHKNLARLTDISAIEGDRVCLAYSASPTDITLSTALVEDTHATSLTWPIRVSIALGITEGLKHLSNTTPPQSHGDLASHSILLQGELYVPKILWAGVAKMVTSAGPFGTAGYLAPEYANGTAWGGGWTEGDLRAEKYALGVVFGEIMSGTIASTEEHFISMSDMRLEEDREDIVEVLTNMSEKCKADMPASRPTYDDVINIFRETEGSNTHDAVGDDPESDGVEDEEPNAEEDALPPMDADLDTPPLDEAAQQDGTSDDVATIAATTAAAAAAAAATPTSIADTAAAEAAFLADPVASVAFSFFQSQPRGATLSTGRFGDVFTMTVGEAKKHCVVAQATGLKDADDAALRKIVALNEAIGVSLHACSNVNNGELFLAYKAKENDTTLAKCLENERLARALTWPVRISIALGITKALQKLRGGDPQVAHQALSAHTILLDSATFVPSLLLAGVSSITDGGSAEAPYEAPELASGAEWCEATEVFALGVLLGEIMSGTLATKELVLGGFVGACDARLEDDTAEIVDTLTSLAEKCMHDNANMRPTYSLVVQLLSGVAANAQSQGASEIFLGRASQEEAMPAVAVPVQAAVAAAPSGSQSMQGACHFCNKKIPPNVTRIADAGFHCPPVAGITPVCFTCNPCLSSHFKKNFDNNKPSQGIKCSRCNQRFDDLVVHKKFIEDEANAYFAKIYKGDMKMDELIEVLRKYKNYEAKSKENLVYKCMIQCLFSEFKYLDNYPAKELRVTADLLGGLIASKALKDEHIKEALGFIVQKLAKIDETLPEQPKLVKFAVWALQHFMHRLAEWDQFSKSLNKAIKVPALCNLLPGLSEYLIPEKPAAPPAPAPTPTPTPAPKAKKEPTERTLGTAHIFDISTLGGRDLVQPDDETQDRLAFVTNNLDVNNLDSCCREIQEMLRPEWVDYFGDYIVVKRASLEPNFHKLYLDMIAKIGNRALSQSIIVSSIYSVRKLLSTDKVLNEPSEKKLLKNLGSWLGMLTVGKNRPLMSRDLDLKGMLRKACGEGMLPVLVPFVVKVIEQVVESPIFRPPNPWTMSVLYLLGDIYSLGIKLMLKFEVEVLCIHLGIELTSVTDSTPEGVEQRRRIHALYADAEAGLPINPDNLAPVREFQSLANLPAPIPAPVAPVPVAAVPAEVTAPQKVEPPTGPAAVSSKGEWPNAPDHPSWPGEGLAAPPTGESARKIWRDSFRKHFEENVQAPASQKEAVARAMERATKEIMRPVVERSICIATTATVELVTKDFALDNDKEKMLDASLKMVKCLVAHLAIVTCKDMLKQALKRELGKDLDRPDKDTVVEDLVRDNLDACMRLIEQVAVQEASEIQEPLNKKGPVTLPEKAMKLPPQHRPEVLQPMHLKVYDDFEKLQSHSTGGHEEKQKAIEKLLGLLLGIEQAAESHYTEAMPNDDNILSLTNQNFTQQTLSSHHDSIKKYLCSIPTLITEEHADAFAEAIFTMVFEIDARILSEKEMKRQNEPCNGLYVAMLLNEVCLFILQSVRDKNTKITSELTTLYLKHERRWKAKDIAVNFIRLKLIDVAEFDTRLTGALTVSEPQRAVVEFASGIVQKCLLDEKLTSQKDLRQTLEALTHIANKGSKKQQERQRQQQLSPATVSPSLTSLQVIPQALHPAAQQPQPPSSAPTNSTPPSLA